MIEFDDKEYSDKDIERAKYLAPNALRRCYVRIAEKLDDFDHGLFTYYEGKHSPSEMEVLAIAHHQGIRPATVCSGLADDLAMYLTETSFDMPEEDYIAIALSSPKDDWVSEEEPSTDIDGEVREHFGEYLEDIYYSPHVQLLLKEKAFQSLLELLNIDDAHAVYDSCMDWIDFT